MPGIIGLVGSCATAASITSSIASICHFPHYSSTRFSPTPGLQLANVLRDSRKIEQSWHQDTESNVAVLVNGTITVPGTSPKRISGMDVLQAYLADNFHPERYDGSFVIAIADLRTQQLIIFNDKLGTLPCYYYSDPNCFCFAPEAKAIFCAVGLQPEYSENGLITFLVLGYCLASTTLFDSIRCLEPASQLVVDVRDATYSKKRYWSLQFNPAPAFRSRRTAEEALYESILAGHRSVFADADEQYSLLLSGGWDSRGMLAAADQLERKPQRSISWGLRDDVPGSDPFLAAQLAENYGIDHHFIAYDTDSFIENATQWSYLTELNTDNFGWYGEGTNILLREYVGKADYMLAGDECWGFGTYVRNREEGMAATHMPAPFPNSVTKCLNANLAEISSDIYFAEIDKVLSSCVNDDPSDRKDFLYLHGRVARFIFSLGYYKELAVEIRRPFLTTEVLDVVQQLPARLRYGKNLYISTLIRYFPELLTISKRSANSLPKWRFDLRNKPVLSRYFASLLSSATISRASFAGYLNLPAIEQIAARFFSSPYTEITAGTDRSARQGAFVQLMKQHITAFDDLRLALHLRKPIARRLDDFDLLRRLALLTLLDQNLSSFARPSRLARCSAPVVVP